MKILITTDTYEPAINGVVTSVKTLAHELEQLGHEVRIFAPSDKTYVSQSVYYMKSIHMDFMYPDAKLAARNLFPSSLVREIEHWNPDIVHSQTEFSTHITARKIARTCKAPLISTVHTYYEDYTQYFSPSDEIGRMAVSRFMRLVLKDSAAVVVPSMKIAQVVESYGVHVPVFCIPTGISLEKFSRVSEKDVAEVRTSLGIGKDDMVFVSVGRIGEEKNPRLLLTGFIDALNKGLQAKLLFVGDGPQLNALKSYVRRSGMTDHVFFAGRVEPDKVPLYYRAGNVFVNASTSETQGLTYLEALCSGIPLLVHADPCLAHVLREGDNGFSFTSKDEYIDRLFELTRDHQLVARLSVGAKISSQLHSSTAFGRAMQELYTQVLERVEQTKPSRRLPILWL